MKKKTIILSCLFASLSCGNLQTQSQTNYTLLAPNTTYKGIGGLIEVIRQNKNRNFSNIKICVSKTNSSSYTDKEFLLETKLAYVSWMSKSGVYSSSDWQLFQFEQHADCVKNQKQYAAINVIDQNPGIEKFTRNDLDFLAITLGPILSYSYSSTKRQWEFLLNDAMSAAYNPYVTWKNIKTAKKLPNSFVAAYDAALEHQDVSYDTLKSLDNMLANSKAEGISRSYETAYHTILHEIGHQFRIAHADNPHERVSYVSGSASNPNDTGYTTDQSVMAYRYTFLYLTQDDIAAISRVSKEVQDNIATGKNLL